MRILLVGPFPSPIHGMSLANSYFYELSKKDKLDIIKHDTVFYRRLKPKNEQGRFDIVVLLLSILDILKLFQKIIFNSCDVIYITPGQSSLGFLRFLPVVIFSKLLNVKIVQHIHGSRLISNISKSNSFILSLSKINIKLTDKFIILSERILYDYEKMIPKNKMEVCLNGVKIQKKRNSIQKDNINILFLSNLMKDKGILDIFNMIENYDCDKYTFNFAGAIEPDLQDVCNDFFVANSLNCKYHGVVTGNKKENLFKNADIFILPSYDEGVPLSILEAYSYSCAVITTPVGGIPDIFDDNINGLFVSVNDSCSIYQSLIDIEIKLDFYQKNNYEAVKNKYNLYSFYQNVKNVLYKDL